MVRRAAGFTLIELLVVIAIMALATAGVSFAVRDSAATQLDRDAQRLAALFEAARARSRVAGVPVRWVPTANGFRFEGIPASNALPDAWLSDTTRVQGAPVVILGPEPIIGAQAVALVASTQPDRVLWVATDGLRPFTVRGEAP